MPRIVLVNSLVCIADLHVGCKLGLCPPKVKVDDGGTYHASKFQRKVHRWWRQFWDDWVPIATRGDEFGVVLVGDALEGRHHRATTQWSQNLSDQEKVAQQILEPVVAQCGGRYWHIRGTDAHAGPSGESEESLAKALGAISNEEGQYARHELWKYIGPNKNILVHALHHISTTSSQAYESTAVHKEYIAACSSAARWGLRAPDFVVRAHRHRYFRTEVATQNERGVGVVLPGWQGKTPFVFRLALGRLSPPQFGGIMIRFSEEGEPYMRQKVHYLERPRAE